jgi:hypothetical protein
MDSTSIALAIGRLSSIGAEEVLDILRATSSRLDRELWVGGDKEAIVDMLDADIAYLEGLVEDAQARIEQRKAA